MIPITEGEEVRDIAQLRYTVLLIKHWHDGIHALCRPYDRSGPQTWISLKELTPVPKDGDNASEDALGAPTTDMPSPPTGNDRLGRPDARHRDTAEGDSQIAREPIRGYSDATRKELPGYAT